MSLIQLSFNLFKLLYVRTIMNYQSCMHLCIGMQVFKELGIEVGVYVSSEIDLDAVKVNNVSYE